MAMLVREKKALEEVEAALKEYFAIMLGEELPLNTSLKPDERLYEVAAIIRGLL